MADCKNCNGEGEILPDYDAGYTAKKLCKICRGTGKINY